MNYEYIEQLLERYWQGITTLEEENILRAFFSQDDVPESLSAYRDLFVYQNEAAADRLGEAFDRKILERIGERKTVKVRRLSFAFRLRPLYKAVAVVAVLLTIGNAVQMALDADRNSAGFVKTSQTPDERQVAQTDSIEVDTVQRTRLAPAGFTDINQMATDAMPVN